MPQYLKRKVTKEETESKRQLCKQYQETTNHLTSRCPILTKKKFYIVIRQDRICIRIHYSIFKNVGTEPENWCSHVLESEREHEDMIKGYQQKTERCWQISPT
jgi:hypothetical protein